MMRKKFISVILLSLMILAGCSDASDQGSTVSSQNAPGTSAGTESLTKAQEQTTGQTQEQIPSAVSEELSSDTAETETESGDESSSSAADSGSSGTDKTGNSKTSAASDPAETDGAETPGSSESAETAIAVTVGTSDPSETDSAESAADSIVIWFSLAGEQYGVGEITEGNTAIIADMIAEKTGSDTFEIVPVTPYPTTLQELFTVAEAEQAENARPDYQGNVENWDSYDTVYLGYPLWYNDLPMIVYHFLEDHDFSGKTICPFNTSGSEGLMGTVQTIQEICSGAQVTQGLAVLGATAQQDRTAAEAAVDAWLEELQQ